MNPKPPELPDITVTPDQVKVELNKGQTQTQTMTLKNLSVDAALTHILGVSEVETEPRLTVGAGHALPQLNMHRAMNGAMRRLKNPSIKALQGHANLVAAPKNYLLVGQDRGEADVKVDIERVYFQYDRVQSKLIFKASAVKSWEEDLSLLFSIDSDQDAKTGFLGFDYILTAFMEKGEAFGALLAHAPEAKDPDFPFEIVRVLNQNELNLKPRTNTFEVSIAFNALQPTPAAFDFLLMMSEKSSDNDSDIAPNLGNYTIPLWLTVSEASGVVKPQQQTDIALTFEAIAVGMHRATLQVMDDQTGQGLAIVPLTFAVRPAEVQPPGVQVWPGDTNNDGCVTAADVIPLGVYWKFVGPKRNAPLKWEAQLAPAWNPEAATYADADGNGIVDAIDLLVIGMHFKKCRPGVPAASPQTSAIPGAAMRREYLDAYQQLYHVIQASPDPAMGEMRTLLKGLIQRIEPKPTPQKTALRQNFPNPFNPEIWIPFDLAKGTEVRLNIYDATGRLVRTLDLGYKPAGVYESKANAAYWDGTNHHGERVSSGLYFYQLLAGDFHSEMRKLMILK